MRAALPTPAELRRAANCLEKEAGSDEDDVIVRKLRQLAVDGYPPFDTYTPRQVALEAAALRTLHDRGFTLSTNQMRKAGLLDPTHP